MIKIQSVSVSAELLESRETAVEWVGSVRLPAV